VLYAPEMHEPLADVTWDAARARDAIHAIVADIDLVYDPQDFWPANEWDGYQSALPMKDLYCGAGGVGWGLERLRASGHAETALDVAAVARRALARFRDEPDILQGLELPGTLLIARTLHAKTGEERWRAAVEESVQALYDERDDDGLWTQKLYGHTSRILGPIHGFVGNIAALRDTRGAADILAGFAIVEDGHANWLPELGYERIPRLQWCHGSPGIITTASDYLDEELLLAGAELIWDAGPLESKEKGAGLCHGTAGNGYALLKTFERTGDERWLDRARAFAMHALAQVEQLPARYSLFTGGIGVALYAADCIDARARFPIVDGLDTA
jgi:hypothetical protein